MAGPLFWVWVLSSSSALVQARSTAAYLLRIKFRGVKGVSAFVCGEQRGAGDRVDPATEIGGGNIQIHNRSRNHKT